MSKNKYEPMAMLYLIAAAVLAAVLIVKLANFAGGFKP